MSNYLNINIPVFFAFLDTGFLYDLDANDTGSRWVSESEEELWFYEFKESQG